MLVFSYLEHEISASHETNKQTKSVVGSLKVDSTHLFDMIMILAGLHICRMIDV